jgi:predicted amidophosphoribosyltransferase
MEITVNEFNRLPIKQQNTILFENTEQIKCMMTNYKFHQKVQYGWLFGITSIGTFLAKLMWGN